MAPIRHLESVTQPMKTVTAVLLAAGQGRRMAAGVNKIRLEVAGRSLLAWSLRAFEASARILELVVVCQPAERLALQRMATTAVKKQVRFVDGGERRQDSSLAGVQAARGEIVLVHDSARPFPSVDLIERVIAATEVHGAAVPSLPVVDTVRYRDENGMLIPGDVPRDRLMRMQTPQGFVRSHLLSALASGVEATDDAGSLLAAGHRVAVVDGEETNIKITTPSDLLQAEQIVSQRAALLPERSADESRNIAGSTGER